MRGFSSVPFTTSTESGLSSVTGVAKFSAAGVILEFESKWFGLVQKGVYETRLSLDEILDVKFRKGFMKRGAKIELRPNTMVNISSLPAQDGKITLKIAREDFERARDAVARLEIDLREHIDALPPPEPEPISFMIDASEEKTRKLDN